MKWCLAGLVGVVVLVLCSRWWLPPVLPAVLAQWDVQVGAVERLESGRLELTDVRYAQDSVSVAGDVVDVPDVWSIAQALWRGAIAESLQVGAGALTLTLAQSGESRDASEPVDVVDVLHQVRQALVGMEAYVPALQCDSLTILIGEAQLAEVRGARLQQWHLEAGVESVHLAAPVDVVADLGGELWQLQVISEYLNLQADAALSFAEPSRVSADVTVTQGAESFHGKLLWQSGERVPGEVLLSSEHFTVQPHWLAWLGVERIEQLQVSDLSVTWADEAYVGRFAVTSELPVEGHAALPVQALLAVSGDLRVLSVERCELSGPWGQLGLQNVLRVDLKNRAVLEGAELVASLDLEQQEWIPAAGHLEGSVSVGPDQADGLDVRFDLRGTDLSYGANEADRVELVGEVQGSAITLERLQLDLLEGTDADRMAISGVADWVARTMDLEYEVALGAEWLNAWLREQYFTDELRAKGRVYGHFDAPELEGQVEPVTLNHPLLHPVTVSGELRSLSAGAIDVDLMAQCEGGEVLLDVAAQHRDDVCSVAFEAGGDHRSGTAEGGVDGARRDSLSDWWSCGRAFVRGACISEE